jgi:hypothetical protein
VRHLRRIVFVTVVAVAIAWGAVNGQRPERTVKIPGIDLTLKGDWQVLFYQRCRFAVPVSWHADLGGSVARAEDGSNISIRMFHITSWAAHKAQIKAAFHRVNTTHEDSDRRLWFEIGDQPLVQHYIDVVSGLSVCSALLEVRIATGPDADDTTKRIAESVGPAPEKWPNNLK